MMSEIFVLVKFVGNADAKCYNMNRQSKVPNKIMLYILIITSLFGNDVSPFLSVSILYIYNKRGKKIYFLFKCMVWIV